MGGFGDWVEQVADSKDALDYRRRVSDSETASMWQSLGFGPNYKAAYCMAVCPAGEDVIGPFLDDRKGFLDEVVDPLQREGRDALCRRRLGRRGLRHETVPPQADQAGRQRSAATSIRVPARLAARLPAAPSEGLSATYHFTFTGESPRGDGRDPGQDDPGRRRSRRAPGPACTGRQPHLARVPAEGAEPGLGTDPQEGRAQGLPRLLLAFGRCFPS